MEINCRVLVLTLVCLSFTLRQGYGALWHGIGCDGHKPGDTWFVNHCGKCYCYANNHFSCYSCGVFILNPKEGCYVDHEDISAPYPMCCGKRYVCRGDPKFDSKKFDDYWRNKIIG